MSPSIEKLVAVNVLENEYEIGILAEMGAKKRSFLSFDVADPDLDTPQSVKKAMNYALRSRKDLMHYTRIRGLPEFVESVAKFYQRFSLNVDPMKQVLATVGSGEALYIAFSSLTSKGDEFILPNPNFSGYPSLIQLFGGVPTYVQLRSDFHLDVDAIRRAVNEKTKGIVICTPNNPTGAVYTKEELLDLLKLAEEKDIVIISDENYSQVTYDGRKHFTIASLPNAMDRVILTNGLSKVYAMTGWRLGYLIARPDLIDQFEKVGYEIRGCVSSAIQYAGSFALKSPRSYIEKVVKHYDKRRRLMVGLLREAGFSCHMPEGGFEAFPKVPDGFGGSLEFTRFIAEKAAVLVKPGKYFGPDGDAYFRIVYCRDEDAIEEGVRRIAKAVKER